MTACRSGMNARYNKPREVVKAAISVVEGGQARTIEDFR